MQTKSSITAHRLPELAAAPVLVVPADVITASTGADSRRALNRFASLLGVARPDRRMGDAARAKER